MVTRENYTEVLNQIGLENLKNEMQESHQFLLEATDNLKDWSIYNEDKDVQEMIDLYFTKLNEIYQFRKANKKGIIKDFYNQLSQQDRIKLKQGELSDRNLKLAEKLDLNIDDLIQYAKEVAPSKEKKEPPKKRTPKEEKEPVKDSPGVKQVEALEEEIKFIKRFINFIGKEKPVESVLSFIKSLQRAIVQRLIRKTSPYAKEIQRIQEDMVAVYNKAKSSTIKINLDEKEQARLIGIVGGEAVYKSITLLKRFISLQGKQVTKEQIESFLKAITKAAVDEDDPYYDKVKRIVSLLKKQKEGTIEIDKQELNGLQGIVTACKCHSLGKIYNTGNKKVRRCRSKKYSDAGRGACSHHQGLKPEKCVPSKNKGLGEIISFADMANLTYEKLYLSEPYRSLIGSPAPNFDMMIHGEPGSGKTSFLLEFAVYLAKNHGDVLYVSSEEFGATTMIEKAKGFSEPPTNLDIVKDLKWLEKKPYKFCFIDSVNDLKLDLAQYKELREKYPETAFILILQHTKAGQFRGGKEWEHEVEIGGVVDNFQIDIYRNRYGVKGSYNFYKERS